MEMELISLLRTLWHRRWLILSLMVVTGLVLGIQQFSAEPVYEARVKLQLSTPEQEDVAAYDQYRSISLRDEITVARNNFIDMLQSGEVRARTISQLGLEGKDDQYTLDMQTVRDADFLNVIVEARTAELAAEIVNAHVAVAIAYYGELRARPTNAEKSLFAAQLRIAEQEFRAAEDAFAEFRTQNGIASLESEITTYQVLLEQLQLERDRQLLEEPDGLLDSVGDVDKLIAQRQEELERLLALAPTYRALEEAARQAREKHQEAVNLYSETELEFILVQAAEELRIAEETLAEFRTQNGITLLENELATYQALLEQLQLERDRRLLERDQRLLDDLTRPNDPVGEVDKLIAQRQEELDRLVALGSMYNLLEENAQQAREKYQHVLSKFAEAELKANAVQAANFIQIVEPAQAPTGSVSSLNKLLVLALAGSLGAGVLLAFLLEYVSGFEMARVAPAGSRRETPPSPGPEAALETASPIAPTGTEVR